jgi:hypothetical protein
MADPLNPSRFERAVGSEIPLPRWWPTAGQLVTLGIAVAAASFVVHAAWELIKIDFQSAAVYTLCGAAAAYLALWRATRAWLGVADHRKLRLGLIWLIPSSVLLSATVILLINTQAEMNLWALRTGTAETQVQVYRGWALVYRRTVTANPGWDAWLQGSTTDAFRINDFVNHRFGFGDGAGVLQTSPLITFTSSSFKFSIALPMLLFCVPPLLWVFMLRTAIRKQRRVRQNLCAECGYDLRQTPTCCPECGHQSVAQLEDANRRTAPR